MRTVNRKTLTAAGLAVTIIEPAGEPNGVTLYCLPGGGMSRQYFDLEADGYSMAAYLAAQGFTSVLIDHPGVGDSPPPADPWTLTPAAVAAADFAAIAELRDLVGGFPIGVGHSMGAMLSIVIQARHRPYGGLALLGFSHTSSYADTELAAHLTAAERAVLGDPVATERELVALSQARFGRPLPRGSTASSPFLLGGMSVPEAARAAIDECASHLIAVCGLGSMLKCAEPEMAQIDVPVLVAFGEHDITGPARDTANALPCCHDITLFQLPGAGHNQNVAPNRAVLWNRLARWASFAI